MEIVVPDVNLATSDVVCLTRKSSKDRVAVGDRPNSTLRSEKDIGPETGNDIFLFFYCC